MKINDHSLQQLNSYERLYRDQDAVRDSSGVRKQEAVSGENEAVARAPQKDLAPRDVLSDKEVEALKVLFGGENTNPQFYGARKVQGIRPGLLMDVKG